MEAISGEMRIQMIAPTPFFADRGCHVRILEEARILKKLGNELKICTYHNGRNLEALDIIRIPNIPWYKKLEAGPSYHMLYLDFFLALLSFKVGLSFKPDLIHAHLQEGVFAGKLISKFKKIPLVLDAQGSLTGEMVDHGFLDESGLRHSFFHKFERYLNNATDAVLCSSMNTLKVFREEFKVSPEKLHHIPDGVDTKIFNPQLDVSDLRGELKLEGKRVVLYAGLLTEYQGINYLLEAIPLVIEDFEDAHFLIIGYPRIEYYKKIAKKLKVLEHTTFLGRIEYAELPRYLCLGELAISPKIPKNESNAKLLNYMASGLPTVVFEHPVNRELLEDLGIYAKLRDSYSLASCIKKILKDEKLSKKLSKKVRERAVGKYSWKSIGEKLIEIYIKVLKRGE